MIVYRGDSSSDFQVSKARRSRYGVPALFFSNKIKLAQLYATHFAIENHLPNGGFVYEAEINASIPTINYEGGATYSGQFRNLIYRLYQQGYPVARLTNVIDYPSKKLMKPCCDDIIVVFDFSRILNIRLIEQNVRVN